MTVLVEGCIDDPVVAGLAVEAGAHRLEVCRNLVVGGLTPGLELQAEIRQRVALPLHVLIRPRDGDFCYAGDEIDQMVRDIGCARRNGADGVVVGALDAGGRIDRIAMQRLVDAARPLSVTFHRASDATPDLAEALETLIELGVSRVLTSGGAETAVAGASVLTALVRQARGRIGILACGGIRAGNVREVLAATGVAEVHLRAGPNALWLRALLDRLRERS